MSDDTKITSFYTGRSHKEFFQLPKEIFVDSVTLQSAPNDENKGVAKAAETPTKAGVMRYWVNISGGLYEVEFRGNLV
jgi:hypothetical protein